MQRPGTNIGPGILALLGTAIVVALLAASGPRSSPASAHACPVPAGSGPIFGDLDGNRTVEAADALWVLRDVARLPVPENPCSPEDVDCEGDVDTVDALKILRYVHSEERERPAAPLRRPTISRR